MISIWLTLTLAIWRYNALRSGCQLRRGQCEQKRCTIAIVIAYVGSILLCIPSFVTLGIEPKEIQNPTSPSHDNIASKYVVNLNSIAKENDDLLYKVKGKDNFPFIIFVSADRLQVITFQNFS